MVGFLGRNTARKRACATVALIAGLLATQPGVAVGASPVDGALTITGSEPGYVTIQLRDAHLIDWEFETSIRVAGTGNLFGFLLRPDTDVPTARPAFGLLRSDPGVFCYDTCEGASGQIALSIAEADDLRNGVRFPPGNYRLYLVADGRPATVVIPFTGPGAARAVTPETKVPVSIVGGVLEAVGEAGAERAFGRSLKTTVPSLLFSAVGVHSQVQAANEMHTCWYEGDPGQSPAAYGMRCPEGGAYYYSPVLSARARSFGTAIWGWVLGAPPGIYGLGGGAFVAGIWDTSYARAASIGLRGEDGAAPDSEATRPPSSVRAAVRFARARWTTRGLRVRVRCAASTTCHVRARVVSRRPRWATVIVPAQRWRTALLPARVSCRRRFSVEARLRAAHEERARRTTHVLRLGGRCPRG